MGEPRLGRWRRRRQRCPVRGHRQREGGQWRGHSGQAAHDPSSGWRLVHLAHADWQCAVMVVRAAVAAGGGGWVGGLTGSRGHPGS